MIHRLKHLRIVIKNFQQLAKVTPHLVRRTPGLEPCSHVAKGSSTEYHCASLKKASDDAGGGAAAGL